MANLAFSKKEPWDEVHRAMTTHILDQTDGAFEIRNKNGALCVTQRVLIPYQRGLRAIGRSYHLHTRMVLTYQLGLWDGDASITTYHTDC